LVSRDLNRWALCLAALVLLTCGCKGEEDLLGQKVLVVGLESSPVHLDPRIGTDAGSSRIQQLLFRGLFQKDEVGEAVPDLVQSWEQPDPVTYRFRLRPGVRFHDGRLLKARDVCHTLESILDPALGSPLRGNFETIRSVECPDQETVVLRLSEPDASLLTRLDVGVVAEPGQPGQGGGETGGLIGCGPFRLLSWDPPREVRLGAFAGYEGGAPALREVRFKIVPDSTVRVLELRKGSIHLIQNDFQPEVLPLLERDGRFRVLKDQGTSYSYLGFNLRDPILASREVRRAIAHAIDRDGIIRYLLGGLAAPATGVLSPSHWAYEPDVQGYPYDPDLARRLLDAAGYPDPDGPGPRKRFELTYKTSQNELRRRIAEAIQYQLESVGIGVRLRSYEWGTFFADVRKGNFQIYSLTWIGVTDPDIFRYLFASDSVPPAGANRGRYENPEVDRLVKRGKSVLDKEERKRIYSRVQKILAEDLPYVSLWHGMNVAVFDKRIHGFRLFPAGDLVSLREVWIE